MKLAGKTIVIASGPTSAPLDDVRVITNRSTGRLGSTIAHACVLAGAQVTQLCGTPSLSARDLFPDLPHESISILRYETVAELKQRIQQACESNPDAFLMASAVLDYVPADSHTGKRSSNEDEWTIRLVRNEKLIEQVKTWCPDTLLVGFKLESGITLEELTTHAEDLANRSHAAFVVANLLQDISEATHTAYLIEPHQGNSPSLPEALESRDDIANAVVERIAHHLHTKTQP